MKDFVKQFPLKKVGAGETFLNAGEVPQNLYYLNKGYVRRLVNSVDGKELTIHIFETGSIFPLSWGLNDEVPDFNLVSLAPSELYLIPKEEFLKFLDNNPLEVLNIAKRMIYATEGLAKRVEILSFEKASERLASTLSYLTRHFGKKLPFTHEGLAALTGLSRERVSIEMKKLKDNKTVSYRRGKIKIAE